MEKKIYNTDIETKRKNFKAFSDLLANQFNHGGDKYALDGDDTKESTDWICEFVPGKTGVDWILGTIAKYLARFKNFEREKDILKVATYCYILWLKMGYHLQEKHDEDVTK